jgi:dTDP-4-dehydrorhamnose reductase
VSDQHGSPKYAADLAEMIMVILEAMKGRMEPGFIIFECRSNDVVRFCQKIKELSGNTTCVIEPVTTAEYRRWRPDLPIV